VFFAAAIFGKGLEEFGKQIWQMLTGIISSSLS